jgi:hypothetical protein
LERSLILDIFSTIIPKQLSGQMEKEYAQRRRDMLIRACDSDDVNNFKRVVESLHATRQDISTSCSNAAIDGNHFQMIRYILEQKYDSLDRFMMQRALKASALQVLDVFKEFGWSDVNMGLGQIGPYYTEPRTAL